MYAVIRTGGKQYRVAPEDVIVIEKITGDEGSVVQFSEVLMVGGDGAPEVGAPTLTGASVAGEVVTQGRGDKILVFKKKRRKNYRRKRGHRQELTTVRITEILTGGKTPSKAKAVAKPAAKKAEAKKLEETAKAATKPAAKKAEAKKPAAKAAAKPKAPAKPKPAAKTAPAKKPKKDG
jgi:large subunit ribosomal protein L21